ncbi:ABC transporter permease [Gracilibacillus sp. S3-1-1]|uniref:ABC transporter permease n=1 Tax=Gracilibacillus pellucidus TaxID=3095368 RepID=A0ACC6M6K7_9BACI|nr:ABC transporter permease [Gracilibacillus sp. S3-1-1]MDX8046511.1 ABC transporter permease [Gracilibacillus sp. S3-1-1]
MTFSIKRCMAIFQKDLKNLYRNLYVLTTAFMPLILAFVYSRMGEAPLELHMMILTLSLSLVGTFLQCAMIAEEKEKNTLRGLMLSPATVPEILAGKSAVTTLITLITTYLGLLMMDFPFANNGLLLVGSLMALVIFIALGTWMGLVTRTVMEASIYILPVMFIFGMANMFIGFVHQYAFLQVLEYTPGVQLQEIAELTGVTADWAQLWQPFAIISGWLIVIVALTVITFNKRMMD